VSIDTVNDAVTVRMYNVGFGDAFLLLFPGEDRPHRVLIDCGSHFLGHGPRPIKEVVGQLIEDVTSPDGARIDVVVATHRHQDHVSGFAEAAWDEVEVGEVWMPWTEHPTDPTACDIRERQGSAARRMKLGLDALRVASEDPALALVQNSLPNARAMRTLHQGFAGRPDRCFLSSDDGLLAADAFPTNLLPGVRIHVLGPSRDPAVIRDMNPPDEQSYLWLARGSREGRPRPFGEEWQVPVQEHADANAQDSCGPYVLTKRDRDRVARHGRFDIFSLAVQLEAAVNGTSLVLAFEMGDAVLLFPGDAQWGTWNAMLGNARTMELVRRTNFLKVGHHGSHNATPVAFVQALAEARTEPCEHRDAWAMVSTRPMNIWKSIPKAELLQALGDTTDHFARSDETAGPKPDGFSEWSEVIVQATVPIKRAG
jgi:beta-lactamase superfamily II metal-dependent hydrolase